MLGFVCLYIICEFAACMGSFVYHAYQGVILAGVVFPIIKKIPAQIFLAA